MNVKRIAIGSDHAGFKHKSDLMIFLSSKGYEVKDFGTNSEDSCDYPDYAHLVANAVERNEFDRGILICGSGIGVSIAANRHKGIRTALSWNLEIAELARQHNDANIIALPARFVSIEESRKMVEKFLVTKFEGGRHLRRVEKIELNN